MITHFHDRKELENYLLVPVVLEKTIRKRIGSKKEIEPINDILEQITNPLKSEILGQYVAEKTEFFRTAKASQATLSVEAISEFEEKWSDISHRMAIVPGKRVFSLLNRHLQDNYQASITSGQVVREFHKFNIPRDLVRFLREVDRVFGIPVT